MIAQASRGSVISQLGDIQALMDYPTQQGWAIGPT